jgi:hypothetical protein
VSRRDGGRQGGFDIAVKGNTDLKGAYISSKVAKAQHRLRTGTLTYSVIENHLDDQSSNFGMSGDATAGDGSDVSKPDQTDLGQERRRCVAVVSEREQRQWLTMCGRQLETKNELA